MASPAKFLVYVCLEKYLRRVRCERACSLVFPDTEEHKPAARQMFKQLQHGCLMKDVLKGLPRFDNPAEYTKKQLELINKEKTGQKKDGRDKTKI